MDDIVGVVLSAGTGTRLRPATAYCPKPLLPVAGVEPLFFCLYKLNLLGVKKIVVNAHYLSEQVEQKIQEWKCLFPDIDFRVSFEENILGTGGAIHKILYENKDWFEGRSLILQNGDTLAQHDLRELLDAEEDCVFFCSKNEEYLKRYGPLWINQDSYWQGIGKQARESSWKAAHFMGIHYLSSEALKNVFQNFLNPHKEVDLFNGVYRPLVNNGFQCKGIEFSKEKESFWFDMTNKDFLLEAQEHLLGSCMKSVWLDVLQKRHKQVFELSKGFWSNQEHSKMISSEGGAVSIVSPDSEHGAVAVDLKNASQWFEDRPISLSSSNSVEIVRSVMYFSKQKVRAFEGIENADESIMVF